MVNNKKTLRQHLRDMRQVRAKVVAFSERITTNDSVIRNAQAIIDSAGYDKIGIYTPIYGDPDILALIAYNPHITFALPKIMQNGMEFVCYKHGDAIQTNAAFPLLQEPVSNDIITPNLMFIPGLAFDIRGYRLGLGKGHYDKYLATKQHITKVGVCFNDNLFQFLPNEEHDCRMQILITEHLILKL